MTSQRDKLLEGAALLRIDLTDDQILSRLPRLPAGVTVTLTCGDVTLVERSAASLRRRGYIIAGHSPAARAARSAAFVLVPIGVRQSAQEWWQQVRGIATRIFDLRMGPVRVVLADEIDIHLARLSA